LYLAEAESSACEISGTICEASSWLGDRNRPAETVNACSIVDPDKDLTTPILKERYRGALLGLACGDAVGTSVEFQPRGSFRPLTDMVGGGPFNLKAG
jgi:hypothetical protein